MSRIPFPPMRRPLIAILRGLKPEETEGVVGALIEAGFTAIEIPLNSPRPFESIGIAAKMAPKECLIGAGTVLTVEQVEDLDRAGGRLMVSPNVEPEVIALAAINAIRAVLPAELEIAAVGGVSETNFADYAKIGVKSFGLGSSLYKPGMSAAEVGERARLTIEAYDRVYGEAL